MNKLIISNILSTYLSRIWIGLVSFFSVPYLIKKLGVDAYGVFSLSLVFVGYSALFDFGLGRGIVKYIAEYKVFNDLEKMRKLIRSSLLVYLVIGLVSSALAVLFTRFFFIKTFHIPLWLSNDALAVFYLTAFYLVIRIPHLLFQAISMGYQRITALNFINTVFNTLKILASIVVVSFSHRLSDVLIANIAVGLLHFISLYSFVKNIIPQGALRFAYDKSSITEVFKFSIKSFTADSLGMLLTYVDKIIIGIFLPIASLTFYAIPFELTSRLWEFQISAVTATFPAFSSHHAASLKAEFKQLYIKLSKFIVIISAFFSSLLSVFAKEILTLWVGSSLALKSYCVLQVIGWGVLTGSILAIVGIVFYSVGNINKVIKINSLVVFLHIILCVMFIGRYGIIAVAASWMLSQIIGIFLFIPWINKNIVEVKNTSYSIELLKPLGLSLGVTYIFSLIFRGRLDGVISFILVMAAITMVYGILAWFMLVSSAERLYLKQMVLKFMRSRISALTA